MLTIQIKNWENEIIATIGNIFSLQVDDEVNKGWKMKLRFPAEERLRKQPLQKWYRVSVYYWLKIWSVINLFEWYITDITVKTTEVVMEAENRLSYLQNRIIRRQKKYNNIPAKTVIEWIFNELNTSSPLPIVLWLNDDETRITKDFDIGTSFYDILKYCRTANPKMICRIVNAWDYHFLECSENAGKVLSWVWDYDARNTMWTNIVDWSRKDSMDKFYSYLQNASWSAINEDFYNRTKLLFEKYEEWGSLALPNGIAIPSIAISRDTDWWDFTPWDRKYIRILTWYDRLPLEYLWLIQSRKVVINAKGWIKTEIKVSDEYKSDTNILDLVLQNLRGKKPWTSWEWPDMSNYYTKEATNQAINQAVSTKANIQHTHLVSDITNFAQAVWNLISNALVNYITSSDLQSALSGYSPTGHTHSISDVNELEASLSDKANAVHSHTVSDITDFASAVASAISWKADTWHTHTISDISWLQTALDNKASSVHSHTIAQITGLQDALNSKANSSDVYSKSQVYTKTEVDEMIPTVQTVYDSTITIQVNWTTIKSITLNQANGDTINIPVPTKTSDLTNDSWFITKAVSDLTNYYTKSQTYTKAEVDNIISNFWGFEVVSTLPTTNIKTNVIYLLWPIGTWADKYEERIYYSNTRTKIWETSVDLSNYFNKSTETADAITEWNSHLFMTTAERSKLNWIEAEAQKNTITWVKWSAEDSYRTGNVNITKANIWLWSVDNTSDLDKPISTAVQNALDNKANSSDLANYLPLTWGTLTGNLTWLYGTFTRLRTTSATQLSSSPTKIAVLDNSGWVYYRSLTNLKSDMSLNNVDNTSDAEKPISTAVQNALDNKANNNDVVKLTWTQTIAWTKTFSTSPVVPSKSTEAGDNPTTIATEKQVKNVKDSIWGGTLTLIYGDNDEELWTFWANQSNNKTIKIPAWSSINELTENFVRTMIFSWVKDFDNVFRASSWLYRILNAMDETDNVWLTEWEVWEDIVSNSTSMSIISHSFSVMTSVASSEVAMSELLSNTSATNDVSECWNSISIIADSELARNMYLNSENWINALFAYQTSRDAFFVNLNNSELKEEVINDNIMVIVNNNTYLTNYNTDSVVASAIVNNQTALNTIAGNSTKLNIVKNNSTIVNWISGNSTALNTLVNNNDCLTIWITISWIPTAIGNNTTALRTIAGNTSKLEIVKNNTTIMNKLCQSTALTSMSNTNFTNYVLDNSTYLNTTVWNSNWKSRINSMWVNDLVPSIEHWTGLSWYSTYASMLSNDSALTTIISNTNAGKIIDNNTNAEYQLWTTDGVLDKTNNVPIVITATMTASTDFKIPVNWYGSSSYAWTIKIDWTSYSVSWSKSSTAKSYTLWAGTHKIIIKPTSWSAGWWRCLWNWGSTNYRSTSTNYTMVVNTLPWYAFLNSATDFWDYYMGYRFYACTRLTSVWQIKIPTWINLWTKTYYLWYMFYGCTNLTNTWKWTLVSTSITTIGNYFLGYAFQNCSALTKLPAWMTLWNINSTTWTYLMYYAFSGCTNLSALPTWFRLPAGSNSSYYMRYTRNNCTNLTANAPTENLTFLYSASNCFGWSCPLTTSPSAWAVIAVHMQ